MLNYPDVIMLGLGHRARNGKDSFANILKGTDENIKIIHWADGVYEQCTNKDSEHPLIKLEFVTKNKTYYSVLDDKETGTRTAISDQDDPYLHKIFTRRNITRYQGMVDKDPEILQFWGTNFRRTLCDPNYWVKLTLEKATSIASNLERGIIIISDTRFINEAEAIKENEGFYVKVVRLNEDGSQYIATDRDPNHPSEAELEGYTAEVVIAAKNISELEDKANEFYNGFIYPIQITRTIETE